MSSGGLLTRRSPPKTKSDGLFAAFTGSDANRLVHRDHEDLTVPNAAGLRALLDGIDHLMNHLVRHHDLELHLRDEVDHVGGSSIHFFLAARSSEAFHLGDGHALDA